MKKKNFAITSLGIILGAVTTSMVVNLAYIMQQFFGDDRFIRYLIMSSTAGYVPWIIKYFLQAELLHQFKRYVELVLGVSAFVVTGFFGFVLTDFTKVHDERTILTEIWDQEKESKTEPIELDDFVLTQIYLEFLISYVLSAVISELSSSKAKKIEIATAKLRRERKAIVRKLSRIRGKLERLEMRRIATENLMS